MSTADTPVANPYGLSNEPWDSRVATIQAEIAALSAFDKQHLDIVFMGDSLTYNMSTDSINTFKANYGGMKTLNWGISADYTQGLLYRLTVLNHLNTLKPKVCVILIGTNNIGPSGAAPANTAAEIRDGVVACVNAIRSRSPTSKVILVALLPREASASANRAKVDATNALLIVDPIIDGDHVSYFDLSDVLVDGSDERIAADYVDTVHLSTIGYGVWFPLMQDLLQSLMQSGQDSIDKSIVADLVRFHSGTGAAATTVVVNHGLGVQPVFWLAESNGRTDDANAASAVSIVMAAGMGTVANSFAQRGSTAHSEHNVGTTSCDSRLGNDNTISMLSAAGTLAGRLRATAADANTITFTVDTQFTASIVIHLQLFGGSGISGAKIVDWVKVTTGASQDITGFGFIPDVVFSLSEGSTTAYNTIRTNAYLQVSRAIVATGENQVVFCSSTDNVAAASTIRVGNTNDHILTPSGSTTIGGRGYVSGPTADGFVMTYPTMIAFATRMSSLGVKWSAKTKFGELYTVDDTTTSVEVNTGFVPLITSFWSINKIETSILLADLTNEASFGAMLGRTGTKQYSLGWHDEHAADPTACGSFIRTTGPYGNMDAAGAIEAAMAVNNPAATFNNENVFEWQMEDAEPASSGNLVMWMAIGVSESSGSGSGSAVIFVDSGDES